MIAGCGGGSSNVDHPAGVGQAFGRQAVAVCREALALKRAEGPFPFPDFNPTQPDPEKLPQVATFLEKTALTFATWERRMKALGEPPRGRGAWNDLRAAIETHVQLTRDQVQAARRGDIGTFADDYARGVQTQGELLAAAKAAGVPACAAVDR